MELTSEEKLQNLPKRPKGSLINKKWNVSDYACNYYQIKFKQNFKNVYQYSFQCDPPLPQQSRQFLIQVVKNAQNQLKQKIGLFSYKGNMVWGLKQLKTSTISVESFLTLKKSQKQQIHQKHTIFMKIARIFDLQKDSFITDFGKKMLQVLNIKFKQSLRNKQYIEITRNKYYNKYELTQEKKNVFPEVNLRILRGFSFTFVPMKDHDLQARLNLSTKYIYQINFLEFLNLCGSKDAQRAIIGKYVIAYYGNFKAYKIQDIDYEQSLMSVFSLNNQQKKMTFKDYYFEKYGLKVKDLKQPMLKVITKVEKIINKQGKKEEIPSYGFMVPEFVKLSGLTETQIKHKSFRDVLKFTRKSPRQVNVQSEAIRQEFSQINKDSIFEIGKQIRVTGYELPRIQYETSSIKKCQNEEINVLQSIMKPMKLKQNSWMIVYGDRNHQIAENMLKSMKFAQTKLGIMLEDPVKISINKKGQKDFCQQVRQNLKTRKVSFVFVMLNQYEERYYSQLKRILINEFNISSQFLKSSTIFSKIKAHKSILPIATKVLLQINAKLGMPIWKVLPQHQYWKKKSLIYGALNFKKSQTNRNQYTLSFVGTSNQQMTEFYSDCTFNAGKSQKITANKQLISMFMQWIQSYLSNEGILPNEIIIFRQGSNEYQAIQQSKAQIQALKQVVKSFAKSQKSAPSITYIYVNKRTDTKFYLTSEKDRKGNSQFYNPLPGTVILEDLSEKSDYDFYLSAQKVTQGTSVPTFYKVLYNDSAMPQDVLVEMTHEQCYNYANWNGPVRVPSCLQYASKLSSLMTQHVKGPLKCNQNFKKNLFYL